MGDAHDATGAAAGANAAVSVADFEWLAAERLEAGVHGYFAGGAGDEVTLRENVAAYQRRRLRPRVAVDVSQVTTDVEPLGARMAGTSAAGGAAAGRPGASPAVSPILVAPVAFQRLVDPEGEIGMAAAAAEQGSIMCLSTLATTRPSRLAEAVPEGRRWFQLYCFRDLAVTRALLDEAVAAGFEAVVVTVDAPRAGRRERDLRTGFEIPPDLGVPSLESAFAAAGGLSIQEVFAQVDPSLDWDDLAELCDTCELPVLIKGVLRGDDAARAAQCGAAGVIVSNHGGRQLDRVPASLDVLAEARQAVGPELPLLVDGGIRRGTDVAIALALGANAVLVGRPVLWGLAAHGRAGAARVLQLLREEFELSLALLGCRSPADLEPAHVADPAQAYIRA